MNNKLNTFINAILAGICIGIGCNIYLSCDNKYIGAALFSVGLITIITFGFNLYTGKVGYVITKSAKYIIDVLIILFGNAIGCILFGVLFPSNVAVQMCFIKLSTDLTAVMCKSIMCGMLMFIAVDSYRINKNFLLTFLCIPTFILSGYEHSIADIVYLTMGGVLSPLSIKFITVVILGNAIGGMIIPFCRKIKLSNIIGG
jgi:formate/nitrite transporter FocA (FNT family)